MKADGDGIVQLKDFVLCFSMGFVQPFTGLVNLTFKLIIGRGLLRMIIILRMHFYFSQYLVF